MGTLGVAYHPLETMDERARTLAELSVILAEVGSDHAVIGGIAVGFHARLRATVGVDMLVPRGKLGSLAHALRARGYVVAHTQDMVRIYPPAADPDHAESIADLGAREANPVLEAAARVAEPATVLGHPVRIVPRGALVALKFHAAISLAGPSRIGTRMWPTLAGSSRSASNPRTSNWRFRSRHTCIQAPRQSSPRSSMTCATADP